MLGQLIPDQVPTIGAIGLGLVGLGLGIAFASVNARDTLSRAKKLLNLAIHYERTAVAVEARTRALVEPTQQLPVAELIAATATPVEKLRGVLLTAVDRARDAVTPTPTPRDWAPGEMTGVFNAIVADYDGGTELTLPATPSPWVHPLAVRHAAPPIVHAPRQPQAPPRHETRPAPVPSAATPRARRSENPGLNGRTRLWGATLLGAVPPLEPLGAFPEPFRMPVPQQRIPHDPRRMARLAPDPTRAWRTKVVVS